MTTKHSPPEAIRAQAKEIARLIKEAEKGNPVPPQFKAAIAAARERDVFKVAVVMDDKTLILDLPWSVIRETTRDALMEWIMDAMLERRGAVN